MEGGTSRNIARTLVAVAHGGRDGQKAFPTHAHSDDSYFHAGDSFQLSDCELEGQGDGAGAGRINDRAIVQGEGVVYRILGRACRFGPCADRPSAG